MSIKLSDNFKLLSRFPLDSRKQFETLEAMKNFAESSLYEGIITYNKETKKYYTFDSANTEDENTGKWREFDSTGGDGISIYNDKSGFPAVVEKETLVFAKNDYVDTGSEPNITYPKGFYISTVPDKYDHVDLNGNSLLTKELLFNCEVGGVAKDTSFPIGTPLESVLESIATKVYPLTATISLTPSTLLYKKGDSIGTLSINANLVKGTNDISSLKYYVGGDLKNTVLATDNESLKAGGNFSYAIEGLDITPITTDTTFKIEAQADVSESVVEKTTKIEFINPFIYKLGVAESDNEILKKKGDITVTGISFVDDKFVFKYDSTYTLSKVEDINKFDVTGSFESTTEDIGGENYTVLTSKESCTLDNFAFTFKFV